MRARAHKWATMAMEAAPLADSPFIAGITPREKSLPRFLVTLVTGVAGGLIVGLAVGLFAFLAFAVATGVLNGGAQAASQRVVAMLSAPTADVTSSLFVATLAVATNGPL